MATMTSTGIISLSGVVLNQSMELELYAAGLSGLYNSGSTASISMSDTALRLAAGSTSTNTQISFSNLYSATYPVLHIYTSTGTGTEFIPAQAISMTIELWGQGGQGGTGATTLAIGKQGGGGGGGSYSRSVYNVNGKGGQTISYSVGQSGTAINSSAASGTFSMTSMASGGGFPGTQYSSVSGNGSQGAGGTASGGTAVNTTGNGSGGVTFAGGVGITGSISGDGSGTYGQGANGTVAQAGTLPPAGNAGAIVFLYY